MTPENQRSYDNELLRELESDLKYLRARLEWELDKVEATRGDIMTATDRLARLRMRQELKPAYLDFPYGPGLA